MIALIEDNRKSIVEICTKYGVAQLYLFGSALSDGFDPKTSDIDIAVRYKDGIPVLDMADNYFGLIEDLEDLLGIVVDLVTLQSVKNRVFMEELEKTMIPLYAA